MTRAVLESLAFRAHQVFEVMQKEAEYDLKSVVLVIRIHQLINFFIDGLSTVQNYWWRFQQLVCLPIGLWHNR